MAKKKNVLLAATVAAAVLLVLAVPLFKMIFQVPVIGTIRGAECQVIEIDGVQYRENADHGFSSADRGKYLGAVTNGTTTMRVFSVKGDASGRFIYALWDWEGAFYARED